MRPWSADSVTDVSSVATRLIGGTMIPTRCAAAPSSIGGGILLQSTSNRSFWFIVQFSVSRHRLRQTRSVCARELLRRSDPFLIPKAGLLRGVYHRARVRATRWLQDK